MTAFTFEIKSRLLVKSGNALLEFIHCDGKNKTCFIPILGDLSSTPKLVGVIYSYSVKSG